MKGNWHMLANIPMYSGLQQETRISWGRKTYKGITGDADILELLHPSVSLFVSESRRNLFEDGFEEVTLGTGLGEFAADKQVNGVALVRSLGALLPLDAEDTLVEAHPPVVGLVAGETGAVDTGLLAGSETNDLAVDGVADGVALGVLEGDGGDGQVTSGAFGEGLAILGGDDGVEGLGGDFDVVSVLLEGDAVDGSGFCGSWGIVGVDLENEVLAALLLLEDLESGILVAGGNDTVGDFLGNDAGSGDVDNVAECNDITEAAHAVGASGTGIGLSESRGLNALNVIDKVDLALFSSKGKTNGSTGGRDVLETGGSGLAQSLLELLDQGPGIQRVEEVDVARRATEDLEGQLLRDAVSSSRLLVRVGTISKGHVLLAVAGVLLAEEARDGSVVVGRVLKGLEGVSVSARLGNFALLKLLQETSVVLGIAEDGNTSVVLGGGTDQGHATNVNLLNGLGDADVDLGNGVLEGVQVADDIVDLGDALLSQILLIGVEVTGENATVDGGVQSLDTAAQHLGSLGDGADVPVPIVNFLFLFPI